MGPDLRAGEAQAGARVLHRGRGGRARRWLANRALVARRRGHTRQRLVTGSPAPPPARWTDAGGGCGALPPRLPAPGGVSGAWEGSSSRWAPPAARRPAGEGAGGSAAPAWLTGIDLLRRPACRADERGAAVPGTVARRARGGATAGTSLASPRTPPRRQAADWLRAPAHETRLQRTASRGAAPGTARALAGHRAHETPCRIVLDPYTAATLLH